ncbi:MAG: heme exporter protein CcmD [Pseudomonadales bacterium]|nr:heme exporter protein CcmD [Pseudomonadales bacterium]MBO6565660.1 heme exporter protein CcmD [Pseudomonadales bacterium]MBO6596212.1 heme exporter protein CcmD [Pseudomonadales bacterium]MBO6657251.1 heme exporter protein CcmD [Pseudomonadales bacterium]MBO6702823.1 heme exporter protein CcmD [Pseudomonadales bacterium]
MRFDSFEAFLHMDGHGLFIWAAYGITFIVLLANLWWPKWSCRRIVSATRAQAKRHNAHHPDGGEAS